MLENVGLHNGHLWLELLVKHLLSWGVAVLLSYLLHFLGHLLHQLLVLFVQDVRDGLIGEVDIGKAEEPSLSLDVLGVLCVQLFNVDDSALLFKCALSQEQRSCIVGGQLFEHNVIRVYIKVRCRERRGVIVDFDTSLLILLDVRAGHSALDASLDVHAHEGLELAFS